MWAANFTEHKRLHKKKSMFSLALAQHALRFVADHRVVFLYTRLLISAGDGVLISSHFARRFHLDPRLSCALVVLGKKASTVSCSSTEH